MIPRPADGLMQEDLGDEIVIVDPATDDVHVLNETAADVWRLIDGTRDVAAIAAALAETYPAADRALLAADVESLLVELREKKLLDS